MQSLVLLVSFVVDAVDPLPDDNDVKAGWGAFAIFVLLILAVAFLCWSFAKQIRKVEAADEAGVFDEQAPDDSDDVPPTHTRTDS